MHIAKHTPTYFTYAIATCHKVELLQQLDGWIVIEEKGIELTRSE